MRRSTTISLIAAGTCAVVLIAAVTALVGGSDGDGATAASPPASTAPATTAPAPEAAVATQAPAPEPASTGLATTGAPEASAPTAPELALAPAAGDPVLV